MASEIYLNVPSIRNMAKTLGQVSEFLSNTDKAMEMLSNTLKATAFIGLVGGAAIASYIDQIRPFVQQVSDKCQELNEDVVASVDAFERGDEQGAQRFY